MLTKKSPQRVPSGDSEISPGLSSLPYDLLLNIAMFLDLRDVHALHLTSRSLYDASTTRPVYKKLANDLLRRCRALPLKGFQRLSDLTTEQLIRSVNKATHYETAWSTRSPRPIVPDPHDEQGVNLRSNYMDFTPGGPLAKKMKHDGLKWYKVVSAPPGEEVDWLSPITSSYTLCATKSGKVVCWDVQTDTCLAEWNPGARWELWKCRVEFEERAVFFTMARVLSGSYDDDRVMEFILMRLAFTDGPSGESSLQPPIFSHVTKFRTTGVVMNVFLLDPSEKLLSAFMWVSSQNTIGLYALPDWDKKEYVFIDTGIECVMSANWSCILHQQHIVIHCEEPEAAYQHFYPLSLLKRHMSKLTDKDETPSISCRLPPARTLKRNFIFPPFLAFTDLDEDQDVETEAGDTQPNSPIGVTMSPRGVNLDDDDRFASGSFPIVNGDSQPIAGPSSIQGLLGLPPFASVSTFMPPSSSSSSSSLTNTTPLPTSQENANPYPSPPWYPESAHFVRQWWPSLPDIPRISCTVVLLAVHDQNTHQTRFVLAQHYFKVPLNRREWEDDVAENIGDQPSSSSPSGTARIPDKQPAVDGKPMIANGKSHSQHHSQPCVEEIQDDTLLHMWYISTPFEVVRVFDGPEEEDDANFMERPRPLVAVDFGHAVWIEYADGDDEDLEDEETQPISEFYDDGDSFEGDEGMETPNGTTPSITDGLIDSDPKRLRFVTFPPFVDEPGSNTASKNMPPSTSLPSDGGFGLYGFPRGVVHTLATPPGLHLGFVETINIDQSQGAVILSDKGGKIWILCYE